MQITPKLRRSSAGYIHYCPGCQEAHSYITDEGHRVRWQFNGNLEAPTFTPSMRLFEAAHVDEGKPVGEHTLCHYFLTDGRIQFLSDCDHALAGQTVDLPDLPNYMQGDKYGDGNP